MKKILVFAIAMTIMTGFCFQIAKAASQENIAEIKAAIAKYKQKNYVGCISDLRQYTAKDPENAVAWYYLGTSYMNIALKEDANFAFDRVIQINSVPKLTSYSIQAKLCMESPARCDYKDFTYDEITQLKADPTTFLDQYNAPKVTQEEAPKDAGELEIERLIDGYYNNNIHPAAKEFILQERVKMKQMEMNPNQAYINNGVKTANILNGIKLNNELRTMAMILEPSNNTKNDVNFYNSPYDMMPNMILPD